MNTEPIYVTFEFNGNLADEVSRVKLGIQGLRDESAGTYKRLLADSNEAFNAMSANNRKLAVSIQEDINSLRQLVAAQKANDEAFQTGTMTVTEYAEAKARLAVQEADLRQGIEESMSKLDESMKKDRQAVESIQSKQEALAKLEDAYRKLSGADRNSQEGQQLLQQIRDLKSELSGLDKAYQEATGSSQSLLETFQSAPGPIGQTTAAIVKTTKAALAFIATPLGIFLAGIAAALAAVTSWFRRTEEGENALAVASATFGQVLNSLLDVVDKVGEWLYKAFTNPKEALYDLSEFIKGQFMNRLSAISKMGSAIVKIFSEDWKQGFQEFSNAFLQFQTGVEDIGKKTSAWLDDTIEKIKESGSLQERRNALDEKERNFLVERAQLQAKLDKLRNDAYDMSLPEKGRVKSLKEALRLTDQIYDKEIEIAKEKHDIVKTENSLSNSNKADLEAEKRAEAEVYNLRAQRESSKRMMLRQTNTISNKLSKEESQTATDLLKKELDKKKELYALYYQYVETYGKESADRVYADLVKNGTSYREYILSQIKELEDKENKTADDNNILSYLYVEKGQLDGKKSAVDLLKDEIEKLKSLYGEDLFRLKSELLKLQKLNSGDMSETGVQKNIIINQSLKEADKEANEKFKELLNTYQTGFKRLTTLEKNYKNDIALLRSQITDESTEEEKKRIEDAIKARSEAYGKSLLNEKDALVDIDNLFGEREATFQTWSDSIINFSLKQLISMLEQAEAKLNMARLKAGNDTEMGENGDTAKYRAQIVELQSRIKALTAATSKGTASSFKDWKRVYSVLGTVNSELNDIGANVGGATGEIIKMAASVTTSTLSMISSITTLANWSVEATRLAAEGANKAIIAVEKASVILAVISAAIQIISKIASAFSGLKDAERDHEEYMKLLISLQEDYNSKLIETGLLQDDVWGTDGIGNMINAIDMLGQSLDNYNTKLAEQQKAWKDPNGNFWKKLYKYGTIMGWVGKKPGELIGVEEQGPGMTDLKDNLRYITKKASKGFLGIGGNHTKTMNLEDWVRENLKNPDGSPAELFYKDGRLNLEIAMSLVENNSDRLAGQTQESLESLIEMEKQIQAAEDAMRDYISSTFGSLGDGLSDAIVDAFQNGTNAAETFRDNITDVLNDVGKQMVRNLFVQKAVEQYEKELEEVYKNYAKNRDDNSTADEEQFNRELAQATENFFGGALSAIEQGNKFLEAYDQEMKKHGFDTFKPEDKEENTRTSVAKGIASMSQDSADQLNGSFNALLIYADKTSSRVTSINDMLVTGLSVLAEIRDNTSYCMKLEAIEKHVDTIKGCVQDMNDHGTILRTP